MITVLIVDSNKVYAKVVSSILRKELRDADIDVAINIWELRRRIKDKQYSLVLADLSVMLDEEEMANELKKIPDSTVILWSALDRDHPDSIKKPANRAGLTVMLPGLLSGVMASQCRACCQELIPKTN